MQREREANRDRETHDTLRLDVDKSQYPTVGIRTHRGTRTDSIQRERERDPHGRHTQAEDRGIYEIHIQGEDTDSTCVSTMIGPSTFALTPPPSICM